MPFEDIKLVKPRPEEITPTPNGHDAPFGLDPEPSDRWLDLMRDELSNVYPSPRRRFTLRGKRINIWGGLDNLPVHVEELNGILKSVNDTFRKESEVEDREHQKYASVLDKLG